MDTLNDTIRKAAENISELLNDIRTFGERHLDDADYENFILMVDRLDGDIEGALRLKDDHLRAFLEAAIAESENEMESDQKAHVNHQ